MGARDRGTAYGAARTGRPFEHPVPAARTAFESVRPAAGEDRPNPYPHRDPVGGHDLSTDLSRWTPTADGSISEFHGVLGWTLGGRRARGREYRVQGSDVARLRRTSS